MNDLEALNRPAAKNRADQRTGNADNPAAEKTWTLIGPDRKPYASRVPGTLGGYRLGRLYGRFDCPAALRAIARGGYVTQRVFFLNEEHAKAAGYRPCAVCMPQEHARWKAERQTLQAQVTRGYLPV